MLRFLTAGESHGPLLTAILDGMPAGLPLAPDDLNREMARRQQGYGSGGRMQIERDRAQVTGGVMNGQTTGGPIGIVVENRDWKNWAEKDITPMTTPRPGHADLTGAIKYGYRDLRLSLERASARETAARVAVGAVCKRLLAEFGIVVGGYVTEIAGEVADLSGDAPDYLARFEAAEASEVRCPDPAASERIQAAIRQAKIDKDTLGGVVEVVALNLPPGLGTHVQHDRRLTARLAAAACSVQSIKGVEIGPAFENAKRPGTQVHDRIVPGEDGMLARTSNRSGGLEGGMTTGAPLVVRAAMKPISTTLTPLDTVNLATGEPDHTVYERSDFCATPRAVPVLEAVIAFVLADELMIKLGGDSLDEIRPRFEALRQGRVDDLPMDNVPWRFGYDAWM
ncbi:MAG TPA: chorismate synthase [Aggregatilinea sp.]|nr:chorismate synthase [Aggregatilinea sp.]HML23561.1 chorismate synthase [Aggregatilinea sp.]